MSVDQNAVHDRTSDPGGDRLRKQVDEWFERHGVPQFADHYLPEARLKFLAVPLVVLVAFEVGAAPKLRSLVALLVVPPVVVALLAWARPYVSVMLGRREELQKVRAKWWRLAGLLVVLMALSAALIWLSTGHRRGRTPGSISASSWRPGSPRCSCLPATPGVAMATSWYASAGDWSP